MRTSRQVPPPKLPRPAIRFAVLGASLLLGAVILFGAWPTPPVAEIATDTKAVAALLEGARRPPSLTGASADPRPGEAGFPPAVPRARLDEATASVLFPAMLRHKFEYDPVLYYRARRERGLLAPLPGAPERRLERADQLARPPRGRGGLREPSRLARAGDGCVRTRRACARSRSRSPTSWRPACARLAPLARSRCSTPPTGATTSSTSWPCSRASRTSPPTCSSSSPTAATTSSPASRSGATSAGAARRATAPTRSSPGTLREAASRATCWRPRWPRRSTSSTTRGTSTWRSRPRARSPPRSARAARSAASGSSSPTCLPRCAANRSRWPARAARRWRLRDPPGVARGQRPDRRRVARVRPRAGHRGARRTAPVPGDRRAPLLDLGHAPQPARLPGRRGGPAAAGRSRRRGRALSPGAPGSPRSARR